MLECVKKLKRDDSGAVGMLMGFVLILLIGLIGVTLDISRGVLVQTRIEGAQDAALLAAGAARNSGITDHGELNDVAQRYFDANYPDGYLMSELNERPVFDFSDKDTMSSTIKNLNVKQAIGRQGGQKQIEIKNRNAIGSSQFKGLDVMILVDSSCSMGATFEGGGSETRIRAARRIISKFADNIYETIPNAETMVIAFDDGKERLTSGFVDADNKNSVINTLANYKVPYHGCKTTTYDAMRDGRLMMRNRDRTKATILVYDGAPTGNGGNIDRYKGLRLHQEECDAIKREGSLLYTLFIGDPNHKIGEGKKAVKVRDVVAKCNPGENTFTPKNPAELEAALEKIADQLSKMRITE